MPSAISIEWSMSSNKKFSFKKRVAPVVDLIEGTKYSVHNSQLLISSGIPSFDAVIGGGIPVGSLVLINEDERGVYAKYLLKYFLAEGVASHHACFISSKDFNPEEMVHQLPSPVDTEVEDESQPEVDDKKMTIAWRYENLKPSLSTSKSDTEFGHYFDLSKNIDSKVLKKADLEYWSHDKGNSGETFKSSNYGCLLESIEAKLLKGKYSGKEQCSGSNILRIALHSLDSPLWQYDFEKKSNQNYLYFYKFLYCLRSLIRNSYSACVITLPFRKFKDAHIEKCIHLSDIAIQLHSFAGTECENLGPYKDYHGFFIPQKIAVINLLGAYNPRITNLAFKLRRRKLIIEEFHLPPELEDSTEREQDDTSVLTCSSMKTNKFDF